MKFNVFDFFFNLFYTWYRIKNKKIIFILKNPNDDTRINKLKEQKIYKMTFL